MSAGEISDVRSYTGSLDVTAAIQAKINANEGKRIYFPAGRYKLTGRITVPMDTTIYGDGFGELPTSTPNHGTVIYLSYQASNDPYGFYVTGTNATIRDLEITTNQPAPAASWTANAAPWAIYAYADYYADQGGHRLTVENVMCRNCYDFIGMENVRGGYINNVYGQIFDKGIYINGNGDEPHIQNVHLGWTYWSGDSNVLSYQHSHATGMLFGRVDNPQLSNIFLFNMNTAWRFFRETTKIAAYNGSTYALSASNVGLDGPNVGLRIEDDATVLFANLYCYVDPTNPSSQCVQSVGVANPASAENQHISIANGDFNGNGLAALSFSYAPPSPIAPQVVNLSNIRIRQWNLSDSGHTAIEATSSVTVNLNGWQTENNTNPVNVFSGGGTLTPSLTNQNVDGNVTADSFTTHGDLLFTNTSASTDQKFWDMSSDVSGTFHLYAVNDSFSAYNDVLTLSRSGANGSSAVFSTQQVGIGTTTPWGKLSITGSGTGTGLAFAVADSANTPRFVIQDNGNVGIGTTSPNNKLEVNSGAVDITALFRSTDQNADIVLQDSGGGHRLRSQNNAFFIQNNYGGSESVRMAINSSGNVGIGTTTPTAQLSTTGTVRFSNFGVGSLQTDANGNVSVSSDERLKDVQGSFDPGLSAVMQIDPILYRWKPETGYDTSTTYAGFSAQNVQKIIPEAVGESPSGYLSLSDRPILAALVNATKEIAAITGTFKDSLIAWLGDASNGITAIFARDIFASNVAADMGTFTTTSTRKLCITDGANDNAPLCLTKSQLAALLSAGGASQGINVVGSSPLESDTPPASPTDESDTSPQAPIIALNGNASSTIDRGASYNDLGARITAPTSDLNLGLTIILDDATTTQISIDTSEPGEHTILYTVTSPTTGLTSTVTRTVTVQSPADFGMPAAPQDDAQLPSDEPQPANDNPFNTAPANDNAAPATTTLAAPTAA
ncbi:tail fiber domain-containing protein [Methylocystis sp.]|uniref:tail fiber domain-containing protein n=1 Tax=Methylocystis sp. TaxID=1911079 RepID=UPI003D0D3211